MAKGQKMNDRLKELVLFELACNDNAAEVARTFGLPESTVKTIRSKNQDQYDELRRQKVEELIEDAKTWKQQFIDQAQAQIFDALNLGQQKIKLATATIEGFEEQIDKLIELLQDRDDVKGKDVIELIKALSSVTSIPLSHISTYFGTLYDKAALAGGQPTGRHEYTGKDGGPIEASVFTPEERKALINELIAKGPG